MTTELALGVMVWAALFAFVMATIERCWGYYRARSNIQFIGYWAAVGVGALVLIGSVRASRIVLTSGLGSLLIYLLYFTVAEAHRRLR